ncbi:MAG: hypothetical protein ACI9Y7_000369 [Dokdonia sp.]|jgi:hypothetical protein
MKNIEKTQPEIFHIHIDAQEMTEELYEYAIKTLKFYDSDFNGHPEGFLHFEPEKHLTLKLITKAEFDETWEKLAKFTDKTKLRGYLEGEFIPIDEFIPYTEYKDIPIPFKIERRKLTGKDNEEFRQTEIHLTMEKDKSNPDLMKKLLEAGLYGAYIPKRRGTFLVLTIQGFIKDIVPLTNIIREYIIESGGAYLCTIKEERALKYKLFGISADDLPEIANKIIYN